MLFRLTRLILGIGFLAAVLCGLAFVQGQQTAPDAATPAPTADLPPVPKGVEVLARGPIHEAFATPTAEPQPTNSVAKAPPKALDELPPEEKPDGDVIWVGGYWHWDDERADFLWVTGVWRVTPPGKQWISGYWREDGNKWQWVPGYWTAASAREETAQQITYLPEPPKPPEVALPAEPPAQDTFWVPGTWEYRGGSYLWRAGYWAKVQPGYVWVAAHYRWTPGGYIYIPGYWDLAIKARGVMYAPVVVDPAVVGVGFVYTPAYAVSDTLLVDAFFVRPCTCHYYFGDYYSPVYRDYGFESTVIYSRRHYDSVIVYERWERRSDPRWFSVQIDLCAGRSAGTIACPPRTLVQQNTIIQQNITHVTNVTNVTNNTTNITKNVSNTQMLMPASKLAAANGTKMVPLDASSRGQARQQAQAIEKVALQRTKAEVPVTGISAGQPRVVSLDVPKPKPVGPPPSTVGRPPVTSSTASTTTPAVRSAATPMTGNSSIPPGASGIKQTGGTSRSTGLTPAGTLPNSQAAKMPGGNPPPGQTPKTLPPGALPKGQTATKSPPPQRPPQRPSDQKSDKDKNKTQGQQDR